MHMVVACYTCIPSGKARLTIKVSVMHVCKVKTFMNLLSSLKLIMFRIAENIGITLTQIYRASSTPEFPL